MVSEEAGERFRSSRAAARESLHGRLNDGSQEPRPETKAYLERWSNRTPEHHDEAMAILHMPFQYESLQSQNDIRLLELFPGSGIDALCGRLTHVSLPDAPSYSAFSYVWGNEEDLYPLFLATSHSGIANMTLGHGTTYKRLLLRLNLFEALHHQRHQSKTLLLWIDRICINQEDLAERSCQVALMGRIFGRAQRTIAWLGWNAHEPDYTRSAIGDLLSESQDAGVDTEVLWDPVEMIYEGGLESLESYSNASSPPTLGPPIEPHHFWYQKALGSRQFDTRVLALGQITWNKWFWRVWMIQESLVCRNVHFVWLGLMIPRAWLGTAAMCLYNCLRSDFARARWSFEAKIIEDEFRLPSLNISDAFTRPLVALLKETRELGATEPRDKLYAMLNICHPMDAKDIVPDYSAPMYEVLLSFAKGHMQQRRDLCFLSLVQRGAPLATPIGRSSNTLPSWMPDLGSTEAITLMERLALYYAQRQLNAWSATGMSNLKFRVKSPTESSASVEQGLELTALCLTMKVKSVLQRQSVSDGDSEPWAKLCESVPTYPPTGEPMSQVLESLGGMLCIKLPNSQSRPLDFTGLKISRMLDKNRNAAMLANQKESCLFATEDDHRGLCQLGIAEGDEILFILGHGAPLVVRPLENGRYLYIGQGCIYGFMHGEALVKARAERHPGFDEMDLDWLSTLGKLEEHELPFDTQKIVLV